MVKLCLTIVVLINHSQYAIHERCINLTLLSRPALLSRQLFLHLFHKILCVLMALNTLRCALGGGSNDKKNDKKNASPAHGRAGQQQRQPDKKPEVDDDGFVVQVLLSSELHVCAGSIVFFYVCYMCCVWCRCLHTSSSLWLGWCLCWCLPP